MSYEKKHFYTPCVGLSVYMRSSQYILFIIFIGNRITGVENSTRAHSFPTSPPPPPAKVVFNVNIVHRAASMLYCTTVLYSTQHIQKGRGHWALVLFSPPVFQMLINKDITINYTSRSCFPEESVPLITLNDSQWESRSMNWIIDLSWAPL
jgi:hypothetical protein